MDFDNDGILKGKELEPLGLWFDRNQDGISQPGEVLPVRDAHVSEIYTDGYTPGGGPNALTIKRGYRRNAPGKEPYFGASVDWRTEQSIDPGTLLQKLHRESTDTPESQVNAAVTEIYSGDANQAFLRQVSAPSPDTLPTALDTDPKHNIGGLWFWEIDGAERVRPTEHHGVFTFSDAGDGSIRGRSYGLIGATHPSNNVNEILQLISLTGSKQSGPGGTNVAFTLGKGRRGNYDLSSTATLSGDGMTLNGETRAEFVSQGKKIAATYRWIAKRQSAAASANLPQLRPASAK